MLYDQNDVDSIALCAWKEARGDGEIACRLVMNVIYNRTQHVGFARTIHDVIYGKNQFTSMSVPSDPEFNLEPQAGDAIYAACLIDAGPVLLGVMDDLTNGAVWYANEEEVEAGGWYERNIINGAHPVTLRYGHHTFRA